MCVHAECLTGSLQSQVDSVSFGATGGGLSSYLLTKHRSCLNINQKKCRLEYNSYHIFLNIELSASLVQQTGLLYFTAVLRLTVILQQNEYRFVFRKTDT